ncbi:hypothetical protein RJ641_010354 [Dillenia turbinata]|uniref:Protein HEAT INTOLERANT 4-like n=1 Tax=Dillenia turbinata TaxID=194707 RepID=A0AAN8V3B5_9MAGN
MRKGTKRKTSSQKKEVEEKAKEEETQTETRKETQTGTMAGTRQAPKRARAKASKSKSEPEFFEEKRNLEDLWQAAFPVGTEWDQMDLITKFNWNFKNLEDAFEEGGALHGKRVYLFGCTEPQMVPFKGEYKITVVPVVVAVVSPFPPSDKIGINSVQRETEEIVPMKQMKMDWVPYIPLENRESQVDRLKSEIFILSCTQRRAALKHLKIERVKKYEYCLPYFYQPLKEDELEQNTVVPILFPSESKPVFCEFDWEFDEIEEFTDNQIKDEVISEDQKDAFEEYVKEKVREAKRANREAREARRKALEEMSEETKAAYENMRFYKFYPVQTPDTPDVSSVKAPFINRLTE